MSFHEEQTIASEKVSTLIVQMHNILIRFADVDYKQYQSLLDASFQLLFTPVEYKTLTGQFLILTLLFEIGICSCAVSMLIEVFFQIIYNQQLWIALDKLGMVFIVILSAILNLILTAISLITRPFMSLISFANAFLDLLKSWTQNKNQCKSFKFDDILIDVGSQQDTSNSTSFGQ